LKNASIALERLTTQYFAQLERKIAEMRTSGIDVIQLDIGSPDMPPARHIVQALMDGAMLSDSHGYQSHSGILAFRQSWASMYQRLYQVTLNPESEILPLLGSKEGIFHFTQAFIDPDDIVLIPNPGYLTYEKATIFAGGQPYIMPLLPDRDYLPDLGIIPETVLKRAKIMWLNYPNNPTSAVMPMDFIFDVIRLAKRYDILVCHDAAYMQILYDGYKAPSILQAEGAIDTAIEFNTLSKSYNMAGWRIGAALGNSDALRYLFKMKTQADSGHFLPILQAGVAALNGDQTWIDKRNLVYQRRRDLVLDALHRMGLRAKSPKASLYIWCPVPNGQTSIDFTEAMLEHAHVSLTPGDIFGEYGTGFFRLSLTEPELLLSEAMERIARWI
jgi:LL-diaminopimelate aminotransferase